MRGAALFFILFASVSFAGDIGQIGGGGIGSISDVPAAQKTGVDLKFVTGTEGAAGECAEWNGDGDLVTSGASCGGGGSAVILDLADDASNESTDLSEIATTGDTNGVFSEPSADKLLINLGLNWPTCDTADALSANPAGATAGYCITNIAADGSVETELDVWTEAENTAAAYLQTVIDTKCVYIENPTDTDDFQSIWTANGFAATITKIWCESDQTVSLDLQIDDGTPADVAGTDLVCTSTPDEDEALGGDTSMADGDRLDLVITSTSGTPTWVSICWTSEQ